MIGFLTTWRIWLELGVLAALLACLGFQNVELAHEKAGRADDRAGYAEQRSLADKAARAQDALYRADEARIHKDQQEKIDEKDQQLARARADRVIADAADGRLQQRYAAAVAAARQAARDPAPVASSASAPAGDLQTDMFRRLGEIGRQYRDAAEAALTAGELAEGEYDALTPTTFVLPKGHLGGE